MFHCARKQYQLEGYKAFFKGLGVTMLRSFPVNGVAFFSYEYFMRFMGWKKAWDLIIYWFIHFHSWSPIQAYKQSLFFSFGISEQEEAETDVRVQWKGDDIGDD